MKTYRASCVVIGSGCAGLNAADTLYDEGVTDILLVTEGMNCGTSRNAGSDKQTYYKMALSSDSVDGVRKMALSYFTGGAMSGELALIESANSLQCFYKLVSLGVPFVQNEYGEWLGYQTDHDASKRATSAGPLTSRYMTEALERAVRKKKIPILDHLLVFHLFVKDGACCGALGWQRQTREYVLLEAPNIVLATGGSAMLYRDSVYPPSQTGMSGMAIAAGAATVNYTEWQYGLASTKFRWNLSGTYQQVLPRYLSIAPDGTRREFLADAYETPQEMLLNIFRKGYQWPFDSRKLEGSSRIDVLVHEEIQKGNQVFLDFRQNPVGFFWDAVPEEACLYLKKSGALQDTPVKRLRAMNEAAYLLYLSHGIDLEMEPVQVAVCAQHQNGGLRVDHHYETTVKGLYAAGEAAGVFGIARPGGSALNSTQVSSLRAAKHIALTVRRAIPDLREEAREQVQRICWEETAQNDFAKEQKRLQADMSDFAGFFRNESRIAEMLGRVKVLLKETSRATIRKEQMEGYLKYRDMLLTLREVLPAMILWCRETGGRGGAAVRGRTPHQENRRMVCAAGGKSFLEDPRPVPASETWFEQVYSKRRDVTAECGLVSVSFRQNSPEEILAMASCAGLKWMEWGSDVHVPPKQKENAERVAQLTQTYGMRVSSYGTYYKLGEGHKIEPYLIAAKLLKTDIIRIWAGTKGSASVSRQERKKLAEEGKAVCTKTAKEGIRVCFEYHPDTLTDTPESALLLLAEIQEENCGLYWQPDYQKSRAENLRSLKLVLPHVTIIHLFYWGEHLERYPLERGTEELLAYLEVVRNASVKICLEFVPGDDLNVLPREAKTLFRLLRMAD